ncbi:MAG: metallophosphoesterase family protein [Chloroflexi bacterium]|nr:metallophosphoesterase family protein [Chloroflexota bacterium]
MKYALLADIHSNFEALTAVLEDIKQRGDVDEYWCLGDIVGYGPEPHRCIRALREMRPVCVAGNHDWAATGRISTSDFNPEAAEAAHWTSRQLSQEDRAYLTGLPTTVERENFTLAHGSPRYPIWEYITSVETARVNFRYFKSRYCAVGHSHVPFFFRADDNVYSNHLTPERPLLLDGRYILNPGGVGQPRDGDPRASYAIYDSRDRIFTTHRVHYELEVTQIKMVRAGLPRRLAQRLKFGV